jgi:hypothetical protein
MAVTLVGTRGIDVEPAPHLEALGILWAIGVT